jgi:hypothetical protein
VSCCGRCFELSLRRYRRWSPTRSEPRHRSITTSRQRRSPRRYSCLQTAGQDPSSAGEYELDHIVPLALGGHPRALDNLQLQPWPEARRKDRLEVKLQCLVCSGQVSLGEAQTAIATDWEAAYHSYAAVPCHRDRHPTVRTADHGTSAPRQHSTASSWLARVRQWLPTLSWHALVRGSA